MPGIFAEGYKRETDKRKLGVSQKGKDKTEGVKSFALLCFVGYRSTGGVIDWLACVGTVWGILLQEHTEDAIMP